jgi:hypothetical protein
MMASLDEIDTAVVELAAAMGSEVNGRALVGLTNVTPQDANAIFVGPASGADAAPTFRAMVLADLPLVPGFSAYRTTNQTMTNSAFTKVQFTSEEWDIGGRYDAATNHRFTPNVAGKYFLSAVANVDFANTATSFLVSIFKNGSEIKRGTSQLVNPLGQTAASVAALVEANGSTDYFEIHVFQASGAGQSLIGTQTTSWFQGSFVSK